MFRSPVLLLVRLPLTNSNCRRLISRLCALILLATLAPAKAQMTKAAPPDVQAKRSPVLAALQAELERSLKTLGTLDPPAYFIGYTVTDTQRVNVSGSNGALLNSDEGRNRWLEVSLRAGSYTLDNSHKVGERQLLSPWIANRGKRKFAPTQNPSVARRPLSIPSSPSQPRPKTLIK